VHRVHGCIDARHGCDAKQSALTAAACINSSDAQGCTTHGCALHHVPLRGAHGRPAQGRTRTDTLHWSSRRTECMSRSLLRRPLTIQLCVMISDTFGRACRRSGQL
jgi:hypothetical protein